MRYEDRWESPRTLCVDCFVGQDRKDIRFENFHETNDGGEIVPGNGENNYFCRLGW